MKINHIAIYVKDLEKSKEFFIKYLGAKIEKFYHNEKTDFKSYFLVFDTGAKIELMSKPEVKEIKRISQKIGYVHLSFSLGSEQKVNDLMKKFKEDGFEILDEAEWTDEGCYEGSILDLEGNEIELTI